MFGWHPSPALLRWAPSRTAENGEVCDAGGPRAVFRLSPHTWLSAHLGDPWRGGAEGQESGSGAQTARPLLPSVPPQPRRGP